VSNGLKNDRNVRIDDDAFFVVFSVEVVNNIPSARNTHGRCLSEKPPLSSQAPTGTHGMYPDADRHSNLQEPRIYILFINY